jgi:hypothetical protein
MKAINKTDLERLLALAEHLDALLLNNGEQIIGRDTLANL